MRCLITSVKQSIKGGESRKQRSEDVSEFTIGRGSNQVLQVSDLRVAIEHSRLSLIKPGRYKIEALTPGGVVVDDKRAQQALINPGSVLRIGDNEIRIMPVDDQHDICVEVHQLPSTAAETAKKATGGAVMAAFPISKRRLSWLLFGLVLLIGLGLPLAGYFMPELREPLRETFPNGDNAWLSGDISSGGCRVMFASPVGVGDIYRLEFDSEQLQLPLVFARCVRCSLVREDGFDAGFSFFSPICLEEHSTDNSKTELI